MTVVRNCDNCGSEFKRVVAADKVNKTRFCSKKCLGEWTAFQRGWDGVPWEFKSKEYHSQYSKDWLERNPDKREEYSRNRISWYQDYMKTTKYKISKLDSRLKFRYGINLEQYNALLEVQNGNCALCGNPPKQGDRLCVDHDAESGAVRKLLCRQCNVGLGNLRHSSELLRRAAEYLEEYKKEVF